MSLIKDTIKQGITKDSVKTVEEGMERLNVWRGMHQNGLDPDIRVDVLKEDIEKGYDRQQAAAIQYLTTGTTSLATSTVAKK